MGSGGGTVHTPGMSRVARKTSTRKATPAPKPATTARPTSVRSTRAPAATEFSTGRGGALRRAATARLAATGLGPAQASKMPNIPGISQKEPDGPATPGGYTSSKDRLYNCGPAAVASVLRGFGIPGLPATNTALVNELRKKLGTSTPDGTGAAALPGVFAQYGLRTDQKVLAASDYTNRNFFKLKGTDARAAALEKVLGKAETAALVADIKAGKTTWEQARLVAQRRETENFVAGHVEQGHPVLMNVSIRALHPNATGGGHYVTVTGVERGPDGKVTSYAIVDPWTGRPATVSADQLWKAIEGNSTCAPTAVYP